MSVHRPVAFLLPDRRLETLVESFWLLKATVTSIGSYSPSTMAKETALRDNMRDLMKSVWVVNKSLQFPSAMHVIDDDR
jgi:hypothetical protein